MIPIADRTVKVTLIAQATGYIAGMDTAARKTRELGSEAERLAQKRAAFEGLGRGLIALGIAAAVGVGFAIAKYAEFDQAMSQTNAILQENIANQRLLRDAALEAGGATVFTAVEAANAEEELGKAGLSTAQILGGALVGSLDLAAAGQLGVARAAEITGITLKQFNLQGSEAGRVADVLAAGANKAIGGVEELAQGLKFVGPVADSMNVSLEDTVATLALFADRGVLGEQAGTSLRGVLASLTSPSKEAKRELDRLNVSLYDGNGQFLGMENAAGQLHSALAGLTDAERDMALGMIFGNMQVTAARILVSSGAEGWREYREAVDDSGIAARIANERMNNLAGDVEKLGGALDTALIQTGSGANEVLRAMVQAATGLVDVTGELPSPVLAAGLAITASAAAVALLSGATLRAIPGFSDLRLWMNSIGLSGGQLVARLAGVTVALALVTYALGAFAAREAEIKGTTDALTQSLDKTTGALTDQSREIIAAELSSRGAFDAAERFGVSQRELTDAVIEGGDALEQIRRKAAEYAATGPEGVRTAKEFEQAVQDVRRSIDGSADSFEDQAAATADATDAAEANEAALAALEGRAGSTGDEIDALADKIRGFGSAQFDLRDANREVEQALDDLQASLAENGRTFDISTDKGRKNQEALDKLAKAYLEQAAATGVQTGSLESAIPVLDRGREAFVKAAVAAGKSAAEAEELADQLGLLPDNVRILIDANTAGAEEKLKRFFRSWNGRTVAVNVNAREGRNFAYGGYTGPGGKHDIAGVVHAGEFVSTAETLAKPANRAALEYMHAGGDMSNWRAAPQYIATQPTTQGTQSPGMFEGRLYLDSGELLGVVRGEIQSADERQQQDARGRRVR